MGQLASSMGKLQVAIKGAAPASQELFPARPSFGTKGTPVTLWANYYQVITKIPVLYKYTMDIAQVATEPESYQSEKKGKPKGQAKAQSREVKGRKLYSVIKEALKELSKNDSSLVLATEFKSQLVSLRKLEFDNNPLRLSVVSEANPDKTDLFDITFHGPAETRVGDMSKYIESTSDTLEPHTFPRFPDVIDALNVIFGYGPRTRLGDVSAVGSSRFFPFKNGGITTDMTFMGRPLVAARGFFQSARLGTGRLLLNANVTHGVFKIHGKVDEIFRNMEVRAVQRQDRYGMSKLRLMDKFLPKTRVWVTMKLSNGKEVRRPKAIHSLAKASEIKRSKAGINSPKFQPDWEFAGPQNVSFYLEVEGKGGKYISVSDYYKQSRCPTCLYLRSCY